MTRVQREARHGAIGWPVKKMLSLSAPSNEPGETGGSSRVPAR
jgi:hypothetical protein